MKTRVIFRHFKGETLAIFPRDPGSSSSWWNCICYAHQGQHGVADPHVVTGPGSRLATPAEVRPLARELRRAGYRLDVGKRITRHDTDARRFEWNRIHTNRPNTTPATA